MFRHHSHIGTTACADLPHMLKDTHFTELRGSPKLETVASAQTNQRIEELAEVLARAIPPDFWDVK
ncbi:hypothetical protein [Fodinicurvata sp. EGI_FJ10296]|uniref:hypothetical protein n=1 Tax=Fodinicurvata sp. EGI_FJ10296 TaxID=3231908 RepID=UPI003452FE93